MLKEIRQSKHMTQMELAIKSGLSLPTVGRVERGDCKPSYKTAVRIARALGIDWRYIYEEPTR